MKSWRRPGWLASVLLLLGVVLFVRLGFWQLQRAQVKAQLERQYMAAAALPAVDFPAAAALHPATGFPRYRVSGRYLADRVYLLDNPRHDERGGVEVYVPLQRAGDARLLLVDLGFLAGNGSDQTPQRPALNSHADQLQGLYLPPPGVGFRMGGNALQRQSRWPKTTVYLDLAQIAADLGQPLYPRVLALDADGSSIYQRRHGLDFGAMTPSRHRAYAFQWFSFALAAIVIFLIKLRRRRG